MESIQGFWQLGDELRRHSENYEDKKWLMVATKLAEQTRSKGERIINLDLSKGYAKIRHRDNYGFYGENRFDSFNFNILNLETKMNENVARSSLRNIYDANAACQNPVADLMRNISRSNYNNSNLSKEPKKSNNNEEGTYASNAVDKRFKPFPVGETLPRNEVLGGYIFVCNNDTMQEDLKRQLFGLPPRYKDSVRTITPGLPLFLYNYTTHQLHGIFEAASFGSSNIDPTTWEDKKNVKAS